MKEMSVLFAAKKYCRSVGKQVFVLALFAEKEKHRRSRKQKLGKLHPLITKEITNTSLHAKCAKTWGDKMRKVVNNNDVIYRWQRGEEARNGKHTLHTDGKDLYSYNLRIGFTTPSGKKVAVEHRAPNFVSITTSQHVGLASWRADFLIHPDFAYHLEETK